MGLSGLLSPLTRSYFYRDILLSSLECTWLAAQSEIRQRDQEWEKDRLYRQHTWWILMHFPRASASIMWRRLVFQLHSLRLWDFKYSMSVLSRRCAVLECVILHSLNFERSNGNFPGLQGSENSSECGSKPRTVLRGVGLRAVRGKWAKNRDCCWELTSVWT